MEIFKTSSWLVPTLMRCVQIILETLSHLRQHDRGGIDKSCTEAATLPSHLLSTHHLGTLSPALPSPLPCSFTRLLPLAPGAALAGLCLAGPGAAAAPVLVAFAELLLLLSSAAWLPAGPSSAAAAVAAAGNSSASAAAVLALLAASLGTGKKAVVETFVAQLGAGVPPPPLRKPLQPLQWQRSDRLMAWRPSAKQQWKTAFWSKVRSFCYTCPYRAPMV